jgi:hypothetical protein
MTFLRYMVQRRRANSTRTPKTERHALSRCCVYALVAVAVELAGSPQMGVVT